ncbi:lipolytic enzyme, GDSL family [Spiroplasma sabaudiense Ar-1343]|uniref:Lipolytic enzyme, GDSL family n=2 Tax=Spiroplasma sabaudiense TaxID=216944 RepID=W6ABQ6_9MOLU|nr:lipolytic enzyme, GDSL family [Spiroplasma sabaudiense Ar-1343]
MATLSLLTSASLPLASCTIPQKENFNADDLIGKNIDTSKQVDDSNNQGLFTNFYTVGDSLSDTGALIGSINQQFGLNLEIDSPSWNNSFTNSDTAAKKLAIRLGFNTDDWNYAYNFGKQNHHGNNYAVGGATASSVTGGGGLLLNKFKIKSQTEALIRQHKVKKTDLVFFEIGGNDLFQVIGKSQKFQQEKIEEAIEEIRQALLVLLNNGIEHIIVMNAPDVSKIPSYNTQSEKVKQEAHNLSQEFNEQFQEIFDDLDKKHPNKLKMFDLYTEFNIMLDKFEEEVDGGDSKTACVNMNTDLNTIANQQKIEIKFESGCSLEKLDQHFFFDGVHPTEWGHEYVAEKLYQLALEWEEPNNA